MTDAELDLCTLLDSARAALDAVLNYPLGHTAVFQVIPLRILGAWVWG